ncbi:MAG: hypothetical protein J0I74_15035 [Rhodanobacter sp.]|nr:hypothetical protein [Rhodanobacter sp.]
MDALKLDDSRDFVTRQYAHLLASGLDEPAAHARLREVLGADAVALLGGGDAADGPARFADAGLGPRLAAAAKELGGSAAGVQAAFIHSLAEARLFALDWWRPVRTFLSYVLFLLGLALVIVLIYATYVLPAFSHLDRTLGVHGAADWIAANGAIRLFAPLLVMAIVLVLLATRWLRMRRRMAQLQPLGRARAGWLDGKGAAAYEVLRCLEFAAALKAAGVTDAAVLEPALRVAGWPAGTPLAGELGEKLAQAERLGTFGVELEWQRRLHWTTAQAQLESSRDRLILASRVLFYILVGVMVTVLYVPIFSVASMVGVH